MIEFIFIRDAIFIVAYLLLVLINIQFRRFVCRCVDVDDFVYGTINLKDTSRLVSCLLFHPDFVVYLSVQIVVAHHLRAQYLLCRFEFQRTLLEHIFLCNCTVIIDLIISITRWLYRTCLLQELNNAQIFRLAQSLKEHKTVHLTVLDICSRHFLYGVGYCNATSHKDIKRQFHILSHFDRVAVVLMMDKLAHLRLIFWIAGDHGHQVAERNPIAKVLKARHQQATGIVE